MSGDSRYSDYRHSRVRGVRRGRRPGIGTSEGAPAGSWRAPAERVISAGGRRW
ncbi:hypothetical protein ACFPM0_00350 [Pseudonocardia sulfidoxydans]|uniref:hypothetical protein n=1 Tax=Pseudonocardia sulfidoxydans TaxID=54011 RepID=UPI0036198AB2